MTDYRIFLGILSAFLFVCVLQGGCGDDVSPADTGQPVGDRAADRGRGDVPDSTAIGNGEVCSDMVYPDGCAPACGGRECGPDGCGGSCGECGDKESCTDDGLCRACEPDCTRVECGPDPVCSEDCGGCQEGYACKQGKCVEAKPGLPPGTGKAQAVARRVEQVAVDGYLAFEEWSDADTLLVNTAAAESHGGKSWQIGGETDLDATVALLWNDDYLFVAAEVTDDVHDVGDIVPGQWWWDDGISFFFNLSADMEGDGWLDGDNAFTFLFTGEQTENAVWWRQGHNGGAKEMPAGPGVDRVVVMNEGGYVLEAAIPMTQLSENIEYQFGKTVGFTILLADPDNDCQESPCQLMWVGSGDEQSGWGKLVFDEFEDSDGDGFGKWIDCEDEADWAHPGGVEIQGNGYDDDCDGQVDSAPDCPEGEKGCGTGCCGPGEGCLDGKCCDKDCGGKECGPDGCGGSCGTCPAAATCTADGICASGMDAWPSVPDGGPAGIGYPPLEDAGSGGVAPSPPPGPRTIFQTNAYYQGELAVRADQVLVHRHSHDASDIKQALSSWAGQGYAVARMYFSGSDAGLDYSGSLDHPDVERNDEGKPIEVDGRPYMVPSPGWNQWVKELTQMSIDGGAQVIYPEEPLLHQSGGYSQRFKDAWQDFYGSGWQKPSSSTSSFWMAGKLKARLYYDLIAEMAEFTASQGNGQVGYVVPVHCLLSFAAGKMIFPHGRTFNHPKVDGMIGQVWTWPVKSLLDGKHEQCSTNDAQHKDCGMFEAAFLLYSYFANLARGSGKSMYFLADPADDNPNFGWPEYEEWYKETVTAGLFFPWISQFELLPWPDRIYLPSSLGGDGETPESYRIQLQAVFNAQQDLGNHLQWTSAASNHGLGIVVGDSFMWPKKSPFKTEGVTGVALPLVRYGVTVDIVPIERFDDPGFLVRYRTLLISFDGWKPLEKTRLEALVDWVESGGVLLVMGSGDAYDGVNEWWTQAGFSNPTDALLSMLGAGINLSSREVIMPDLLGFVKLTPVADTPLKGQLGEFEVPRPPIGEFEAFAAGGKVVGFDTAGARTLYETGGKTVVFDRNIGDGALVYAGISPTDLGWNQIGSEIALALARYAGEAWGGLPVRTRGCFHMQRGPYHVVSVHKTAPALSGHFVDIFHPDLPLLTNPKVPVGRARLYRQADELMSGATPRVLHSNQELTNLVESGGKTSFTARGPKGTPARVRVWTAGKSVSGVTGGVDAAADGATNTVLLKFGASASGKGVELNWN